MLIWRYGAAFSAIEKFVAPDTENAAPALHHNYVASCAYAPTVNFEVEYVHVFACYL